MTFFETCLESSCGNTEYLGEINPSVGYILPLYSGSHTLTILNSIGITITPL